MNGGSYTKRKDKAESCFSLPSLSSKDVIQLLLVAHGAVDKVLDLEEGLEGDTLSTVLAAEAHGMEELLGIEGLHDGTLDDLLAAAADPLL
mmetsp:Transcript_36509/g.60775  ORF Transcript_36509/g.60775 Transcript_36509/m.60775 type:complete len:91 (+) Transcript_36509:11-283(+)